MKLNLQLHTNFKNNLLNILLKFQHHFLLYGYALILKNVFLKYSFPLQVFILINLILIILHLCLHHLYLVLFALILVQFSK